MAKIPISIALDDPKHDPSVVTDPHDPNASKGDTIVWSADPGATLTIVFPGNPGAITVGAGGGAHQKVGTVNVSGLGKVPYHVFVDKNGQRFKDDHCPSIVIL